MSDAGSAGMSGSGLAAQSSTDPEKTLFLVLNPKSPETTIWFSVLNPESAT